MQRHILRFTLAHRHITCSRISHSLIICDYGAGKAAEEVGINFILKKFPAEITQEELIKEVRALNEDESVHGFVNLHCSYPPRLFALSLSSSAALVVTG